MVMDEDEEANNLATHHELLKNRMTIQNNVVNKRKEQLKAWEKSEMNKLPAVRKPPSTSHVKFQDSDIFFSACVSGDEDEVEDLLDKGANVNTSTIDGVTALHQAVIDNKFEMVRFLVNHGSDINAQDNEGWTPLHAAVCCGNILIVKFLCEKGSDITVANSDKELAVDLAEDDEIRAYLEQKLFAKGVTADECRGYEEKTIMRDCMEWIRAGKYLDKPHKKTGATALHVAASKGYNKLISLLIQAGADVHAQDFEGWTPLHAAAHWGEKDACRILMSRGADITKRTMTGQDVLQVADAAIVEYLEQASPSNTSSSISSIKTSSRSITPEEESSSSLYSSDQSVAFTLKIPNNVSQPANSSSTTQSSAGSNEKQQVPSSNNSSTNNRNTTTSAPSKPITEAAVQKTAPPKEPPPVPPKSTTPTGRIVSPTSESTSSNSLESSSATMSSRRPTKQESPKSHLTAPTIASIIRQRPAVIRDVQTSNPPWVRHWKSEQGSIQIGSRQNTTPQRAPSAASSTSSTATEMSTSPAPGFFRPSLMQAIQPTPAYKKYAEAQVRSWQTPPQQPTPQKESEAERKAKSRLQRASRRSTQGVTLDQLNEARSAASSPTVSSSASNKNENEDIGKWKSSALQQQSNKTVSSRDASSASETISTPKNTSSCSTSLKPTVTTSISSVSKETATQPNETPSAPKVYRRRSEQRSNRNVPSPIESDMSVSASSNSTGRDIKQTSSSQVDDGTKSPTAIVQPILSQRDIVEKPCFVTPRITLQDRVNSVVKESGSDDSFKPPPVIPKTTPKSDSFQNGAAKMTNLKDATFGSTSDLHYKALYEKSLIENERLRSQIEELKYSDRQKDSSNVLPNGAAFVTMRKNNGTTNSDGSHPQNPNSGNSNHLDESDRRAYERKISELEYELQKAKQLQSDHKRLKDENNALIRVISKLSKDYPSSRQGISSTLSASSTGAQTKSATSSVSK